jgi:GNAT superfamily N-acetyltransferase
MGDVDRAAEHLFGGAPSSSAWEPLSGTHDGRQYVLRAVEEEGRAIELHGEVRDAVHQELGSYNVEVKREGNQLVAKVYNVFMSESAQGRGVGNQLVQRIEETFRRLGVNEIRLSAAQVGRYYWAKQGYEWSPETGQRMHSSFRAWLSRNGHDVGEAGVALRGARALAESTHGKAFLLAPDTPHWSGTKRVAGASPAPARRSPVETAVARANRLGVANAQYAREGMRDMRTHHGAYAGVTSAAEATRIATGQQLPRNSSRAFPPITVVVDHGEVHVRDGRHRLAAARAAGATHIRAVVKTYVRGRTVETEANLSIQAQD